jgi:hypothetical protein
MSKNYVVVSGLLFGLVAVAQVARAIAQVPVLIGSFELPLFASWIAAAITAGLSYWAFRSRN